MQNISKQEIAKFYEDLDKLGLKFPGSAIHKATGRNKGTISSVLSRKKDPSSAFIKDFYKSFAESLRNVSQDTVSDGNKEAHAKDLVQSLLEKQNSLMEMQNRLLHELKAGIQNKVDSIDNKVKGIDKKMEGVDSNLKEALGGVNQLSLHVESAREVVLESLARLEKRPTRSLRDEADSKVRQLMKERKKQNNSTGRSM